MVFEFTTSFTPSIIALILFAVGNAATDVKRTHVIITPARKPLNCFKITPPIYYIY